MTLVQRSARLSDRWLDCSTGEPLGKRWSVGLRLKPPDNWEEVSTAAAERFGVQRAAGMNHVVDRHDVLLLLDAKIAPIQPLRCNAVFGRRAVTAVVVAACYIGLRRQRA